MRSSLLNFFIAVIISSNLSACMKADGRSQREEVERDSAVTETSGSMFEAGKIYLASPEIVNKRTGESLKNFLFDEGFQRKEILRSVTLVFEKNSEVVDFDVKLIRGNVDVFSENLNSKYPIEEAKFRVESGADLLTAVHVSIDMCGFQFKEVPDLAKNTAYYGVEIPGESMCKFLGVLLGVYGYRVVPVKDGLAIKKEW